MIYQCEQCKKVYSTEKLIKDGNYKVTKEGLLPICPNCGGKKFKSYNLEKE